MINCFASQIPFLQRYCGIDLLEQGLTVARFRGIQAGVRYVEGFQRYQGAGWGNLPYTICPELS